MGSHVFQEYTTAQYQDILNHKVSLAHQME